MGTPGKLGGRLAHEVACRGHSVEATEGGHDDVKTYGGSGRISDLNFDRNMVMNGLNIVKHMFNKKWRWK